ncbi:radical SAM protein [Lysinibacter sp. HNR]|uniref:B12-binding domain-containing radical SAM protein n=1 Tax=Lysinibacter sp. HNR TaxID=3031408 RepID=UPI002435EEAA|nr:radical SAM protein [Lysinibacter sp. HNR]WGD37593.1 radical SAM protein [Lysinibacter sp. HNR]
MKVLVVWPPHVPSYFNAGHHLTVYTTSEMLRSEFPEIDLTSAEFGLLNLTWKEIGEQIYQSSPDLVIIINDFDTVDNLDRFIEYIRSLAPGCHVITGGRLSMEAPLVFRQFDLDGIVTGGDVELGFYEYVSWMLSEQSPTQLVGIDVRDGTHWIKASAGRRFLPGTWPLPDVSEIPYHDYDRLYSRDQNKFCGIPERRELVVPVGRGCPINCSFCEVPTVQGLRDRRLSAKRIVDYIETAVETRPFDYVSFYAPTFTFDRKWTLEFCAEMERSSCNLPWKCATAIPHLDAELMKRMAESGCVRISVGLETLEPGGLETLPRKKRTEIMRFEELNNNAHEFGIELNFFIMVGLPGTTLEGTRATVKAAQEVGARVRPTVYADLDELRRCQHKEDLWRFNRQLLGFSSNERSNKQYPWYEFFFGVDPHVTSVMNKIPQNVMERV